MFQVHSTTESIRRIYDVPDNKCPHTVSPPTASQGNITEWEVPHAKKSPVLGPRRSKEKQVRSTFSSITLQDKPSVSECYHLNAPQAGISESELDLTICFVASTQLNSHCIPRRTSQDSGLLIRPGLGLERPSDPHWRPWTVLKITS